VSTSDAALVGAGIAAGLCGSIAGLASLFSYPALLAYGLPPLSANVTNTVALIGTTVGSVLSSRPELRGQGRRVLPLLAQAAVGGLLGAGILLGTPAGAFAAIVPALVALGGVLLLSRDRLRDLAAAQRARPGPRGRWRRWLWPVVIVLIGVYCGYFGAGAGIIMLAVLSVRFTDSMAVTNALKNSGAGIANAAAAVVYLVLSPVDWRAVLALGVGNVVGAGLGPYVVRIVPERPFRYVVAIAAFGLAAALAFR
jgi:uncharacterized membrane protein YfcA